MPGPYSPANPPPWAMPSAESARWGGPMNAEYMREVQRLTAGEDAARQQAIGLMTGVFNERGGGYLEDRDIQRMYASASDQAARARMTAYRGLRSGLGQRGITGGGYASGLGARVEMERLGQLANQQRSLKQFQTTFNAEQGGRRMQGAQALGGLIAQGPSDTFAQGLGNVMGLNLTAQGLRQEREAAAQSSRDTRRAGTLGLIGQLGGGLLGAVGAAI